MKRSYTQLDLAYAAGLIDGEGCIGVYAAGERARGVLQVCMNDRAVLDWLHALFGGCVTRKHVAGDKREEAFVWQVNDKDSLVAALEALLPHFKVKRACASLVLTYYTIDRTDPERYCALTKALNSRGPGSSSLKLEIAEALLPA